MVGKPRLLDLRDGPAGLVDEEDWPLVKDLTVYVGKNGYLYYSTWEDGRSVPRTLHSLLVGTHPGKHVDHINGDKFDNRRSNLRVVTRSQNQVNRKRLNKNNRSGVRGVHWDKQLNKWIAQITHQRKNHYLGVYANFQDAVAARRKAEHEFFGEVCP